MAVSSISSIPFVKFPELVADKEIPNNHTIIYRNKIFPEQFIKINTTRDSYRCLQKCPIEVTIENNWFDTEGNSPIEFDMETKNKLKFRETTKKSNFKLKKANTQKFIIEADVPFGMKETKFNVSINLNGKNILLDPKIASGCTTNHTTKVVECNGTINGGQNGGEISTNFSIYIHDAILNMDRDSTGSGTNNNGQSVVFKINSTLGWINITNTTIYARGEDGSTPSIKTTCGTGATGGGGGSSTTKILFNQSSIINKSTFHDYAGNGGTGQQVDVPYTTDCAGNVHGGTGGLGGSGFMNITSYENNTLKIYNSILKSPGGNGGKGGQAGSDLQCSTNGAGTQGNGGNGGTGKLSIMNASKLTLFNVSIDSDRGGAGQPGTDNNACDPGSAGSAGTSKLSISVLNELTLFGYSNTFDGRNNTNISSLSPSTGYHWFNITSTVTNRFAMFNFSNIEDATTLYCNAASLTYGNDTASIDPELTIDSSCVMDNNVTFTQYFENVVVTANSPDDLDYTFEPELNVSVTVDNTAGNSLDTVILYLNHTGGTWKANQTLTSIPDDSTAYLNASNIYNGIWQWYVEACTGTICGKTSTRNHTIDTLYPTIDFVNPNSSGNISIYNLTFNIAANSSTLNWTNVTIFNNSVLYKSFFNYTNKSGNRLIFQVNFTQDGNYSINVTATSKTHLQNKTSTWFYYDKSSPNITITSPTPEFQTFTTQTASIAVKFSDKTNILDCWYWIVKNITGITEVPPATFVCNSTESSSFSQAGLTDQLNYTLHINVTDGYNKNETIRNFRIDTTATPPASSGGSTGGGGGGTTIISADENIEFEILSDRSSTFYEFRMIDGDLRERNVVINNKKNAVDSIELSCEGEICQWLKLSQSEISVEAESKKEIPFALTLPKDTPHQTYEGRIKGVYKSFNPVYLDITIKVDNLGIIFKQIKIPKLSPDSTQIYIDAWVASLLILIFSFVLSTAVSINLFKNNPNAAVSISFIFSLITSILFLFLI